MGTYSSILKENKIFQSMSRKERMTMLTTTMEFFGV